MANSTTNDAVAERVAELLREKPPPADLEVISAISFPPAAPPPSPPPPPPPPPSRSPPPPSSDDDDDAGGGGVPIGAIAGGAGGGALLVLLLVIGAVIYCRRRQSPRSETERYWDDGKRDVAATAAATETKRDRPTYSARQELTSSFV